MHDLCCFKLIGDKKLSYNKIFSGFEYFILVSKNDKEFMLSNKELTELFGFKDIKENIEPIKPKDFIFLSDMGFRVLNENNCNLHPIGITKYTSKLLIQMFEDKIIRINV